jgi:hypothetical protein
VKCNIVTLLFGSQVNCVVVLRILPDKRFIDSAIDKATEFYKVGVLPVLLGKWYSKAPVTAFKYGTLHLQ